VTLNKIEAVRSVAFGVRDVRASARFYTEVWGLTPVAQSQGAVYLRGAGPHHHILSLIEHPSPEVLGLDLLVADRATVDALHAAIRSAELPSVDAPDAIPEPGGGYGFRFKDLEGRTVRILSDDTRHQDAAAHPDRPSKIVHVVLNSSDVDGTSKFYCDFLGFELINRIKVMSFLKCNEDHHSLAFAAGPENTLNHIAFAMTDVSSVARGASRMLSHGYPIGWGIGQHTAGEDVYAYFEGPDGCAIEYITKVSRGWDGAASGIEHWDVAPRPTAKQAEAMRRIRFA
jgi:catechol-2,3-dioxygenase